MYDSDDDIFHVSVTQSYDEPQEKTIAPVVLGVSLEHNEYKPGESFASGLSTPA